jgi:integrase
LLDQVRERIRYKHYSFRTEQAYLMWIRRFIRFHALRHPREMGAAEIEAFLSHLANERDVSSSTHNQAFSALLFLYGEVLGITLPWLGEIKRPKRPRRLPVILTREEVRRILGHMDGTPGLMAKLMYGTGIRLMECARLRMRDLDLPRNEIVARQGRQVPGDHGACRAGARPSRVGRACSARSNDTAREAGIAKPATTRASRLCSSRAPIYAPFRSSSTTGT